MVDGDRTSTNPSGSDCGMSTPPTLVVVSTDVVPAVATASDPDKRGIGFQSSDGVVMLSELVNNDNNQQLSNFQQLAKDNTITNTSFSLQIALLNKVIIPIWRFSQYKPWSPAATAINHIIWKKSNPSKTSVTSRLPVLNSKLCGKILRSMNTHPSPSLLRSQNLSNI